MRTNVVIDDDLMLKALKSGRYTTKRSVIEDGLRILIQINSQKKLRNLRGKINWEANLEKMRRD